jgi:hypothetical protein
MITRAEAKIAEAAPKVADAAERVQRAKDRLERLRRGEALSGGLGKRLDIVALLKGAGFTPRDLRRWSLLAALTPDEDRLLSSQIHSANFDGVNRAVERTARKIIRVRRGSV